MKNIAYMLIIITLLTSCATRKRCERKFPAVSTLTTKVNTITVIRDTTIFIEIPGDTTFISVPLVDGEISKINTPLAISYAWVTAGKLNHRLEQKDTVVTENIKGALKTTVTDSQRKEVIKQVEFINQLSWWQWLQVYLGRVFLGVMIVVVGSMIINRFIVKVRVF